MPEGVQHAGEAAGCGLVEMVEHLRACIANDIGEVQAGKDDLPRLGPAEQFHERPDRPGIGGERVMTEFFPEKVPGIVLHGRF